MPGTRDQAGREKPSPEPVDAVVCEGKGLLRNELGTTGVALVAIEILIIWFVEDIAAAFTAEALVGDLQNELVKAAIWMSYWCWAYGCHTRPLVCAGCIGE